MDDFRYWPIPAAAAAGQWGLLTEILRPDSAFAKSDLIDFPHGLGCRGPNLRPSPRSNRTPERVLTTRSPRATDHQPPHHGMADCVHRATRDDTERNFRKTRKTKYPFLRKRNQCLAEGFPSCSVGAAPPCGGDVNPLGQRPSPASLASGPRPSASRQSGGSCQSSKARAGYCTTPVPQRRCMKRSHGANRVLSVTSPMMMITSMIPITWSMALSSRP